MNRKLIEELQSTPGVDLVAVTKKHTKSEIDELAKLGLRRFGENRVQEMSAHLEDDAYAGARLHFIGHLQTNKVRQVVGKVSLIHSVSSLPLLEEIEKEAAKKKVIVNILVEVNVAEEESKFGTTAREAVSLVEQIAKLPHVRVRGLMTIAPYVEDSEQNRRYFAKLKQIYVDIIHKNIDNVFMEELSMGMTGDYEVAITEGATYVRVGTGIFGEREYATI